MFDSFTPNSAICGGRRGGGGGPDALHLTMIMEDVMKAGDCPETECQWGPGNIDPPSIIIKCVSMPVLGWALQTPKWPG